MVQNVEKKDAKLHVLDNHGLICNVFLIQDGLNIYFYCLIL